MTEKDRNELHRREFLRKAAITGAVAWAVPVVQSVAASPAFAQQAASPTCCGHSETPSGGCGNCMDACKTACGNASGCSALCDPNTVCTFPDNTCPPNRCNPGCYRCDPTGPVFTC
jgi:hypothetical protein